MVTSLADKKKLRREYSFGRLSRSDLDASPLTQFTRWFGEAEEAGLVDVSAMALATADVEGRPTVRIVLLKHFDESDFVGTPTTKVKRDRNCHLIALPKFFFIGKSWIGR